MARMIPEPWVIEEVERARREREERRPRLEIRLPIPTEQPTRQPVRTGATVVRWEA